MFFRTILFFCTGAALIGCVVWYFFSNQKPERSFNYVAYNYVACFSGVSNSWGNCFMFEKV